VAAIERGFQKGEIERSAYRVARQIDAGERVVVGVNRFISEAEAGYQPMRADPSIEEEQAKRLARLRAGRDGDEWRRRIDQLRRAAAGPENILVPLRAALAAQATVGEVCDAMRDVWGTYRPPDI
jgi:methylmalonyl-CoA mutase N-terminal domain/subunit